MGKRNKGESGRGRLVNDMLDQHGQDGRESEQAQPSHEVSRMKSSQLKARVNNKKKKKNNRQLTGFHS